MRTRNKLHLRKRKSVKNLITNNGLYCDVLKWRDSYMEHIETNVAKKIMSAHTLRSYTFVVDNLLIFILRNYNIDESLAEVDEVFFNEYFEWLENYNYNSVYGTEDFVSDTINVFLDYCEDEIEMGNDFYSILNMYITEKNDNENVEVYSEILNEFVGNYMENYPVVYRDISDVYIDKFIRTLERKKVNSVGMSTMKQRRNSLIAFFSYISDNNSDKINLTDNFKYTHKYNSSKADTTKNVKRKKGYSEGNQMKEVDNRLKAYYQAVKSNKRAFKNSQYNACRNTTLALIMMYGGLRSAEVLALKFEDIKETENNEYEITINFGKGGKSRTTYTYAPLIRNELEDLKELSTSEYLSATRSGAKMSYDNLRVALKKILGDLYNEGLHTFRHTFGTQIAESGDIALVAELLGHSDLKTTQIYIDISKDRKREVVSKLQEKMFDKQENSL